MFQQARTDLGVIVQVLSVPCDFHTGIYLCFPLILGDLKYKNNTKQPINNKRTCNHLSRFLQSNFDWSKPGDVEGPGDLSQTFWLLSNKTYNWKMELHFYG